MADAYGFKDKQVALDLKNLRDRGIDEDGLISTLRDSPNRNPASRYVSTFVGTVTEEISASTSNGATLALTIPELDDLTIDELVNGLSATEGFTLGSGKMIILLHPKETVATIEKQEIDMISSGPELHEIDVFNYSDQVIPVTTGTGPLTDETVIHLVVQDNFGDYYVVPNQEGEPGQPGPPGPGAANAIYFECIEHMALADEEKFVKVLNPDGTTYVTQIDFKFEVADEPARLALAEGSGAGQVEVTDIIAQTTTTTYSHRTFWQFDGDAGGNDPSDPTQWSIVVSDERYIILDPTQQVVASASYNIPSNVLPVSPGTNVRGFTGKGDIAEVNKDNEGFSTLHIVEIQSFAQEIEVKLYEDIIDTTSVYKAGYVRSFGTNPNERPPAEEVFEDGSNPDYYGVLVYNTSGAATGAYGDHDTLVPKGEHWIASLDAITRRYILKKRVQQFVLCTGTAKTALDGAAGTIGVEDITRGIGPLPVLAGRDITATTSVPLKIEIGETVYLLFDPSISSDIPQQWRVTSAYNLTQFLKGYTDYDEGQIQQILGHESGTVKWLEPPVSAQKPMLIVSLTADVSGTGATASTLTGVYDTTSALLKPVAIGAAMNVYNTLNFGASGKSGEEWIVAWSQASAKYELIIPVSANVRVALATSTISAASAITSSKVTWTSGTADLCDPVADGFEVTGVIVSVLNLTKTDLRASTGEPLALILHRTQFGWIILNQMDPRGFPSFDASKPQIMVHDAGASDFYLYDFCFDSDYITSVEVELGDLVYIYPYVDSDSGTCTETSVYIASLGPCDT